MRRYLIREDYSYDRWRKGMTAEIWERARRLPYLSYLTLQACEVCYLYIDYSVVGVSRRRVVCEQCGRRITYSYYISAHNFFLCKECWRTPFILI
jgi:hypothetical protein